MAEQHLTGYRRPDGRVGVRNHVIILPVDDLSNAVCEHIASAIPGSLALPHAYGRLQYGDDLDLTFRTLIGTGSNPNVAAVIVVGIEPNWTNLVVEGIAKTGKPVQGFSIERHGDLQVLAAAARVAQQFMQQASEIRREPVTREELTISIKCGESDTTTGLGSCPTVSQAVDRHVEAGATVLFGETSELTGGEHIIAARCANGDVRERFQAMYDGYLAEIESSKAESDGLTADAGQYSRRPEHDRGKGAGQYRQNRHGPRRGCAGASGGSDEARPELYGFFVSGGGVHHPDGRGGLGDSSVPDGPGQHHWQPYCASDQDHGESADGAHDVRACRSRRVGAALARVRAARSGRPADGADRSRRQWPADLRGGARPPRVCLHQAVSERVGATAMRGLGERAVRRPG